jgi:phosphatidylinositol alpha-1,6-mannosyltransferase
LGREGESGCAIGEAPDARTPEYGEAIARAPKSLFITNDFPPRIGGAQSYYWGLIQTLDPADVVVVAPDQPGGQEFDRGHSYRVIRYPRQQLGPSRGLFRLALALVDEFQPDVVQFGHALPTGLLGPAIVKRTGVPYLVFLGGAEITLPGATPVYKRALRYVLGNAAALAAVSDYTASVASGHVNGRVPVFTLRPAIDGAFSAPLTLPKTEAKKSLGIDGDLVICVGRLVPRKGQDRLIEALALLSEAHPRVHLAIVGSGRIALRLKGMAERLGVAERVHLTGALGMEELQRWMAAADVFASPCRSRWAGLEVEGFGLVFAEACLAGLPVLAGRSGGAPESVKNGETGIVAQGYFKEEVAECLSRLLSLSPEARALMGLRARKLALARHNAQLAGERYREVLSRAAKR